MTFIKIPISNILSDNSQNTRTNTPVQEGVQTLNEVGKIASTKYVDLDPNQMVKKRQKFNLKIKSTCWHISSGKSHPKEN